MKSVSLTLCATLLALQYAAALVPNIRADPPVVAVEVEVAYASENPAKCISDALVTAALTSVVDASASATISTYADYFPTKFAVGDASTPFPVNFKVAYQHFYKTLTAGDGTSSVVTNMALCTTDTKTGNITKIAGAGAGDTLSMLPVGQVAVDGGFALSALTVLGSSSLISSYNYYSFQPADPCFYKAAKAPIISQIGQTEMTLAALQTFVNDPKHNAQVIGDVKASTVKLFGIDSGYKVPFISSFAGSESTIMGRFKWLAHYAAILNLEHSYYDVIANDLSVVPSQSGTDGIYPVMSSAVSSTFAILSAGAGAVTAQPSVAVLACAAEGAGADVKYVWSVDISNVVYKEAAAALKFNMRTEALANFPVTFTAGVDMTPVVTDLAGFDVLIFDDCPYLDKSADLAAMGLKDFIAIATDTADGKPCAANACKFMQNVADGVTGGNILSTRKIISPAGVTNTVGLTVASSDFTQGALLRPNRVWGDLFYSAYIGACKVKTPAPADALKTACALVPSGQWIRYANVDAVTGKDKTDMCIDVVGANTKKYIGGNSAQMVGALSPLALIASVFSFLFLF